MLEPSGTFGGLEVMGNKHVVTGSAQVYPHPPFKRAEKKSKEMWDMHDFYQHFSQFVFLSIFVDMKLADMTRRMTLRPC